MTVPTMSSVREGLAQRAAAITGLNGYGRPTGRINTPAVLILPRPGNAIEYDDTMGGVHTYNLDALLLIGETVDDLSQRALDSYLAPTGDTSLKARLESDAIAIANVDYVTVARVVSYGDVEYSGKLYLGARLSVEVNADGP